MLVLGAALGGAQACPAGSCAVAAAAVAPEAEPTPLVDGKRMRALMRAFGKLRGRSPQFSTGSGTRLSPSMSPAAIERRMAADGAEPVLRVLWGRCASHAQLCSWVELEAHVHRELHMLDCESPAAVRVMRLEGHVIVEQAPSSTTQSYEVDVGPVGCAADERPPGAVPEGARSAFLYVVGSHGLVQVAVRRLPVQALTRALEGP